HELVQGRHEAMHGQHDGGAQPPRNIGNAIERHGVCAVDRHHDDIEPADRREMTVVELVMQVTEMADAKAGDLEDKDRVAIPDHFTVRIVAKIASDVNRDVADQYIAD